MINKKTVTILVSISIILLLLGTTSYYLSKYASEQKGDCIEWEHRFSKEYAHNQCYKENYTNCYIRYNGSQMIIDYPKFDRYNQTYECTKWEHEDMDYVWRSLLHLKMPQKYCKFTEDRNNCCVVAIDETAYFDDWMDRCVKNGTYYTKNSSQ